MTNWETCVQFHGHACGGLTIGYKAACYAAELLELSFSGDEQVVCIAENDACGVDAIQALLGCSIGKGNLLFHMRGKQAFSFYNRATGKSVRLVLRPRPEHQAHGLARGAVIKRERLFAAHMKQQVALADAAPEQRLNGVHAAGVVFRDAHDLLVAGEGQLQQLGGVARGLISDRQPAAGVAVKLYAGFPVGHDLVSFSSSSMSTSLCPCTSTMLPVTP